MRIKRKSSEVREEEQRRWHKHFAWLPRRVSGEEVIWLAPVARKLVFSTTFGKQYAYGSLPMILTPDAPSPEEVRSKGFSMFPSPPTPALSPRAQQITEYDRRMGRLMRLQRDITSISPTIQESMVDGYDISQANEEPK